MKIYDCLTYCGEDLLLKIRFETLYNKIDKFIIVEADKYFNGDRKPKFFNINKFEKYKSKIEYYYIENLPKHTGENIEYENFIKNQINRGLKNLDPEDLVLYSDADEIPNLENEKFKKFDSAIFLKNMYYYKLNIKVISGLKWSNKWPGTRCCKYKFFKTAQKLRSLRVKNIPWWRFDQKINRHIVIDGGWHFSFLMNNEDISSKLKRFTHEIRHVKKNVDYELSDLIDINKIKNRVNNLIDPYDRKEFKLKKVDIDNTFPSYIVKNKNNLLEYII
tara:strand:- start:744 stop:1571 length:828 start_codon:yes stop_codon:yes gene_type:complete